jgi:hypothetical protein
MKKEENLNIGRDSLRMSMKSVFASNFLSAKGRFFIKMYNEDGDLVHDIEIDNLITYDSGILAARLCKDPLEPSHGFNMLSVGTGATGSILSPDAPDRRQRKLNAEISRKAFSSTSFINESGVSVSYPTNVVDFVTTFGSSEAVGPLTEMGILSTISDNPLIQNLNPNSFPTRDTTLDLSSYDILCNYVTFPVMSKLVGYSLSIVWRITFG